MRLPKRGEKGFTLIELLIVVAILGVLAAVVIPNVSRFMGAGKEEAAETELANIQTAVIAMMVDNGLSKLDNPVDGADPNFATNDMTKFPDVTPVADKTYPEGADAGLVGDLLGYVLYAHDRIADGTSDNLSNYVAAAKTSQKYTVDAYGTVKLAP